MSKPALDNLRQPNLHDRLETPFMCLLEIALLLVCLGHVALFIEHADDRPVRARVGAVLGVRDRVADCVGSCVPDRAALQPIAD